jgi:F-type H+-transporting ATPase subunit a
MRLVRTVPLFALLVVGLAWGWTVSATESGAAGEHAGAAAGAQAEHGLPPAAVPLFHVGPLPVTNSMVVTWLVAGGLIVLTRLATRNIRAVPEGAQNFWEWLVESLHDFLEGVIGPDLVKRTFWFFATVFIFILFTNWFGLIPGVGTILVNTPDGLQPLLRGGNADLNMTLAMAMIFFACWLVWALQANGVGGFVLHLFGPKGDMTGVLRLLMIVVFIAVGVLEVVSILFRPVSLSFRLYGNILAGENMLEAMSGLIQEPAWLKYLASVVIPIPFYFLEVLVGLVQALVFMLLTAVFTMLICQHDEGHAPGGEHA